MKDLTKTLLSGLAFSLALYSEALANDCETGYVRGVNSGNCIKASDSCGGRCTYTIDEEGNLTITGDGSGIWSSYIDPRKFQGNIDIVSAKVVKMSRVGDYAFANTPNMTNITFDDYTLAYGSNMLNSSAVESLVIPKATSIDLNIIVGSNLKELILPEGMKRVDGIMHVQGSNLISLVIPESVTSSNSKLPVSSKLYCTQAQIDSQFCSSQASLYERDDNGNLLVYNKDGTIKGVYSDYAGITHDKVVDSYEINQDGFVVKYNGRGIMLSKIAYDRGGNIVVEYDGNGTLLYKRTSYTPAEAAAAVKEGNNNTVTLTFK